MDHRGGDEIRALSHQCQRDVPAVAATHHMHTIVAHMLDQPREVGSILGPASRAVTSLAAAVPAPVPNHHPIPLGQTPNGRRPTRPISPGSVGQDNAFSLPGRLVVQLHIVHDCWSHRILPRPCHRRAHCERHSRCADEAFTPPPSACPPQPHPPRSRSDAAVWLPLDRHSCPRTRTNQRGPRITYRRENDGSSANLGITVCGR